MKKSIVKKKAASQKVTDTIENIANERNADALNSFVTMVKEEYGDFKLTKKQKKELAKDLDIDSETINGWEKVSDFLDHVDIAVLAKKHPEAIGKVAKGIASIVGFFVPAVGTVAGAVPDKIAPKIIEIAGMLTPEHLVNLAVKGQAKKARKKAETLKKAEKNSEQLSEESKVDIIEDENLPVTEAVVCETTQQNAEPSPEQQNTEE